MSDDMISNKMVELAPAKINLTLSILGRRPDKYHLIDSLVVFTDAGDELTLFDAKDFSLDVFGPFAGAIKGENLIHRVAKALNDAHPELPLGRFRLEKNLPVAAGIGGGSSDVAAFLRLVERRTPDVMTRSQLMAFAARFGADIPVCIENRPAFMSGIGEVVKPLSKFPEMGIILINPGIPVITQEVFARFELPIASTQARHSHKPKQFHSITDVVAFMEMSENDLTTAAISVCPQISQVLTKLNEVAECRIARLSGSGATCFGLFDTASSARDASQKIGAACPSWLVAAARVHGYG